MQEGQDWCLQCGAGAPGSLDAGPGWRTGVAILGATALLAVGASVAAYAALTKPKPKPKVVAVAIRPATAVPTTPVPGTATGGGAPGIPTTVAPGAPKIPTQAPTPTTKSSESSAPVFPPETESSTSTKTSTSESSGAKEEGAKEKTESQSGPEPPSPILLDTNAASVYNPYAYAASLFGDPSLTIDGDAKTVWTAQVQPEKAPHMAEGLLLDLKSSQKLGSAAVMTATTGATVEIYGTNGTTLPTSITDPAWTRLVGLKVLEKKDTTFKLKTKGKSFRYVTLWLVKAPSGSTAAKPGDVAIAEFELFPPS
jgi:hypothetical protein